MKKKADLNEVLGAKEATAIEDLIDVNKRKEEIGVLKEYLNTPVQLLFIYEAQSLPYNNAELISVDELGVKIGFSEEHRAYLRFEGSNGRCEGIKSIKSGEKEIYRNEKILVPEYSLKN